MRYLILFLSVIVVFASCSKQTVDVPQSKQDMLIAAKWHLIDIKVTVRDTFGVDSTFEWLIDDCKKDDNLEFDSSFQAIHHTGDARCYNNESEKYAFTWQLTDNGKTLGLYGVDDFFLGSSNVTGDISDLDGNKFTLKTTQFVGAAIPPTDTLKYTKFYFTKL
jgi:hypothetical protein